MLKCLCVVHKSHADVASGESVGLVRVPVVFDNEVRVDLTTRDGSVNDDFR